jgi:hypothetical protein
MINVACVLRAGGKVNYDATWVAKLQRAVSRNLSIPHRFVCLSDCDVPCEKIPLLPGHRGYWNKLQLFRSDIFNNNWPVLYLDLDTVICKSIDEIYQKIKKQKFVMWHEQDNGTHSSALMYWNGDYNYLWELYNSKTFEYWNDLYNAPPLYGDQALISENTKHQLLTDHCPSSWFHIAGSKVKNKNIDDVKILFFRKAKFKPSTMLDNHLVQQHWI